MKDYYAILGVSHQVHDAEIKRAYRRLAIQYHPDKNPSPEAEAIFKEINEAYDVLGDAARRQAYDLSRLAPFQALLHEQPQHRDPRYRPNPGRAREKPYQLILMEQLNPVARMLNFVGVTLVFLFALDYFLPYRTSNEHIANAEQIRNEKHVGFIRIITDNGSDVKLYRNVVLEFGEQIALTRTAIYGIPMVVGDIAGKTLYSMGFMYKGYLIFPVFLLVSSVAGIVNQRKAVTAFNFAVGTGLLMIINYFLIF